MGACEYIGLLKMDFLGLRNLTVLDDCLESIRDNRGVDLVLEELPLDDRPTYERLARGDTLGVFQLDGGPMRALLRSMAPDNFEDISAVGALYRPGPMGANSHNEYADRKNERKPVVPIHPELAEPLSEILGDTYGLIVYQEQVMAIAQKLAGYSLGKADLLRRAMGKKKKEILDKEFEPFAAGIRRCRREKGAYTDFYDFLRKVDAVACNKKTVESLIKAGAFDSLGHTRKGLLAVHADAIDAFLDVKRNEAVGQFDLFGDADDDGPGLVVTPTIPA